MNADEEWTRSMCMIETKRKVREIKWSSDERKWTRMVGNLGNATRKSELSMHVSGLRKLAKG